MRVNNVTEKTVTLEVAPDVRVVVRHSRRRISIPLDLTRAAALLRTRFDADALAEALLYPETAKNEAQGADMSRPAASEDAGCPGAAYSDSR